MKVLKISYSVFLDFVTTLEAFWEAKVAYPWYGLIFNFAFDINENGEYLKGNLKNVHNKIWYSRKEARAQDQSGFCPLSMTNYENMREILE